MTTDTQLTGRQANFVHLMALGSLSATQAYIKAGYSPKGASVQASRTLAKTSIQQAIERKRKQLANSGNQLQVTPEWITLRLATEATDADTASARVAALRTLADIHGMMSGSQTQLPQALGAFLEGIRQAREQSFPSVSQPVAIEATGKLRETEDSARGHAREQAREAEGQQEETPPGTS